ncbi:MAG: TraR/DksA C4-type zinc finger protein [Candidatus Magasanikbacteria bacterium]|nr:TraR/DksA C4-type zinc finger protein [Candidatus Magasanikbacteria bacterium]
MKSPFSNEFLAEIKTALEEQKTRLTRQLGDLTDKETGSAFPNYGEGEDESAEEVATYDSNLQLIDSMGSEMRDVNESLGRLEKGTYGTCKYCGEQIDEQRLRARPTSSSCVACKKALTQEM